jgi:hypothetical protein
MERDFDDVAQGIKFLLGPDGPFVKLLGRHVFGLKADIGAYVVGPIPFGDPDLSLQAVK